MASDYSDVLLFLGAGVSAPEPAGSPLFAEIRDACCELVGVPTARWSWDDPRRALLDHVIPEVFLKVLSEAGFRLDQALINAVAGVPGGGPTAVHRLAARVLAAGGRVWTTNWDLWIETAYEELTGQPLVPAVYGPDLPSSGGVSLAKVHGTAADPGTLMFRSAQILRPMSRPWHQALVAAARRRRLFVVGYAGADVDLYPALAEALDVATASFWFEGVGSVDLESHAQAAYETWRFRLQSTVTDPSSLPRTGRHLVWCGEGATAGDPSQGLLDAFEDPSHAGELPDWAQRYAAVRTAIAGAERTRDRRSSRLLVEAITRERLADRRGAALRHAAVALLGTPRERTKALVSLRNILLLRSNPVRLIASRTYARFANPDQALFIRQHAGELNRDADLGQKIADGLQPATIDQALDAVMSTRWTGDLAVAERIARVQLERSLRQDLDSPDRDWPERVSRAAYELAQALLWRGHYFEADDVCRTGYMRVSGAKWTAWEFAMRGTARFAHGDYAAAARQFREAELILRLEGFTDFTLTLHTSLAATFRALGAMPESARCFALAQRTPRKGPGSTAALLAEQAETQLALGDRSQAEECWQTLKLCRLPMWAGIGCLRLAESGVNPEANIEEATAKFKTASSTWGLVRTHALANSTQSAQIESQVAHLGPPGPFTPRAAWLM